MAQKIAEQGNLQFFMPADHHPIDYRDQVRWLLLCHISRCPTRLSRSSQADQAVNTADAFQKRQHLRHHPKVLRSLDKWWAAVGGEQGISKEEYLQLGTGIALMLVPDEDPAGMPWALAIAVEAMCGEQRQLQRLCVDPCSLLGGRRGLLWDPAGGSGGEPPAPHGRRRSRRDLQAHATAGPLCPLCHRGSRCDLASPHSNALD